MHSSLPHTADGRVHCEGAGKLGLCRTCDHYHYEKLSCLVNIPFYPPTGYTNPPKITVCNCKDWAPHDNLEFLEWKDEKNNR